MSDFFFHFRRFHHDDGIPGAAVEETAVGAFAEALLTTDAKNGINLNAAEGRIILVGDPEHAVFDGAILDAGGRASAAGAALGDDREFFGFLLAGSSNALRARFVLELVGNHARRSYDFLFGSHLETFYLVRRNLEMGLAGAIENLRRDSDIMRTTKIGKGQGILGKNPGG